MVRSETIELTVDGPNGPRTIRVSNPGRVCFPNLGVTKIDVVRYFLAVGAGIDRAVRDRPTMLERWPGGVVPGARLTIWKGEPGQAFYQRRRPRGAPDWVQSIRVPGDDEVLCPTELAVVAWAANLGTLRFHTWPARRADLDHPDELRVDLDPQPGTGFGDAVRVAMELRELLAEHGIEGFPKTSGGRGMHVYASIAPRWSLHEVRRALLALGRELVRRMPDLVTITWSKKERGARVFLDYNQIAGTIASAYSIRPTPRALVSAPVSWDELTEVEPGDFDVVTMPARFAAVGDLHAGLDGRRSSLAPLLDLADRHARDGLDEQLPSPPSRGRR
ncbi:MAG TPA: DNA primase small subunit domain-containing protein [Euzebyales bacterium]|nr:DNA primase small subunit domain-containing protein [Euzebyales bacterium]